MLNIWKKLSLEWFGMTETTIKKSHKKSYEIIKKAWTEKWNENHDKNRERTNKQEQI